MSDIPNVLNLDFITIIGYLYGADFLLGIMLNILTIFVCNGKDLSKKNSFFILSCFSFTNIIMLCTVALPLFLNSLLNSLLEYQSLIWCKLSLFFYCFSFQFSSWIIVIFCCCLI